MYSASRKYIQNLQRPQLEPEKSQAVEAWFTKKNTHFFKPIKKIVACIF
jgi:hypothetical protein